MSQYNWEGAGALESGTWLHPSHANPVPPTRFSKHPRSCPWYLLYNLGMKGGAGADSRRAAAIIASLWVCSKDTGAWIKGNEHSPLPVALNEASTHGHRETGLFLQPN